MNNIPKHPRVPSLAPSEQFTLPWQIEHYKKAYPPGTCIELTADMVDENIPAGIQGTVITVDDIGSVHTAWDSGGSLAVIPGVDSFTKI